MVTASLLAEIILNTGAFSPLILTDVTPPRLVPVTVTSVPTVPEAGEKFWILGETALVPTVKFELLVAVPPAVVTEILPEVAPLGTPVTMAVFERTVLVATTPLKVTCVAPVKFVPEIVTAVPTPPEEGIKPEIAGGGITVNELLLVAVPPGVVTEMVPLVATAGTAALICVADALEIDAVVPLNVTAVAPVRFVPVITTGVPTLPDPGEKLEITGAGWVTVSVAVALTAVPAMFFTTA